jgi:DNA polymerase-3 subunit alpha
LTSADARTPLRMAGTLVSKRERYGKRGNKYAFVALSDDTGGFEVTMFSEVLAASRELLDSGVPLLLTVDAQLEDDKVRLLVSRVDALEKVLAARLKNLKLTVTADVPMAELKDILDQDGRGNSRIVVTTRQNGHWVDVALPGRFAIQPKTLAGLKNIPGIAEIREF